jgi:predicted glycogen debranching enzyme
MGHDERRDYVLLDGHILLIQSVHRFKVHFRGDTRESIQADDSFWYAAFPPKSQSESGNETPPPADQAKQTPRLSSEIDELTLEVMQRDRVQRVKARILSISTRSPELPGEKPNTDELIFLDTNGRGGMLRASANWAQLNSRYDCLLAANLHPNCPVDRHIFLRRWRAWSRFRGHSMEFNPFNTESVQLGDAINYTFVLPQGTGKWVRVVVRINMLPALNVVQTTIHRESQSHRDMLSDKDPVTFIFRPDIEDRNFHQVTKAFEGAEQQFPNRINKSAPHGFAFTSHTGTEFRMISEKGHFQSEPLWIYNHHYPLESSRGLEDHGDMFSPGYFTFDLEGGSSCTILTGTGEDLTQAEHRRNIPSPCEPDNPSLSMRIIQKKPYPVMLESRSLKEDLLKAMKQFIVQRGPGKTVIAGYPWFLDWGRDTLISARGMITAGFITEVEDMLLQFGLFAKNGTIPNMIQGEDASNRDTSDAPLWYILVCRELCECRHDIDFLKKAVDDTRTVLDVILEIARGYIEGTQNGITVEEETGLVYSPAHFTWMDTNYPAGTPREGYPVEIQALWFQALVFLFDVTDDTLWQKLAEQVKKSFSKLFWMEEHGYFADCIRADQTDSSSNGILEDALRPNQVLALLSGLADENQSRRALDAMMKLVVPGALRSIADSEVRTPLPIRNSEGCIINDPLNPFWPHYQGPEDSNRKPAYHNGTAWTWPFPMLCEAYAGIRGRKSDALNLLNSSMKYFYSGCIGQMPEILDGNSPHTARGCDAQAWSVTEWYRVLNILDRTDPNR